MKKRSWLDHQSIATAADTYMASHFPGGKPKFSSTATPFFKRFDIRSTNKTACLIKPTLQQVTQKRVIARMERQGQVAAPGNVLTVARLVPYFMRHGSVSRNQRKGQKTRNRVVDQNHSQAVRMEHVAQQPRELENEAQIVRAYVEKDDGLGTAVDSLDKPVLCDPI